jgi:MFS-type transporter involved in bile tolerance (Atg22 family)
MTRLRVTTGSGLRPGRLALITGVVMAGAAVWVAPLILGLLAVCLGVIAEIRGDRWGRWVVVAAVGAAGFGVLLEQLPSRFVTN